MKHHLSTSFSKNPPLFLTVHLPMEMYKKYPIRIFLPLSEQKNEENV